MSDRIRKINSVIKEQLSLLIARETSMKLGVFVTVTKVDTKPDLRYTRVFVSVFPEKERNYAMETLKKEKGRLQGALNKKLHMKPLPKLEFVSDTSEEEADEIEKIFQQLS